MANVKQYGNSFHVTNVVNNVWTTTVRTVRKKQTKTYKILSRN
jgi:hypothetical protein